MTVRSCHLTRHEECLNRCFQESSNIQCAYCTDMNCPASSCAPRDKNGSSDRRSVAVGKGNEPFKRRFVKKKTHEIQIARRTMSNLVERLPLMNSAKFMCDSWHVPLFGLGEWNCCVLQASEIVCRMINRCLSWRRP